MITLCLFCQSEHVFPVTCRFFVVEDHILNTTSNLVTRATIDELWELAVAKVVVVLRSHIVSWRQERKI